MQVCQHCQGHLVIVEQYDHSVRFQDYKCLMCGRYWPIQTVTAQVDVVIGRLQEYKPWKRISAATIRDAKQLLDAGQCIAHVARAVGINHVSLRKIVVREGWEAVSARPNRRGKSMEEQP